MDDLDERIDALFAGPPGGFTGGRDALARELRAAGDRAGAERVRSLRRPTRLAAEINRIARERPDGLGRLLAAQDTLATAQEAVLAGTGGAGELHDAGTAEAGALADLSGDPAVRAALRAAARDGAARDALVRGRLSADPDPHAAAGLFAAGPPGRGAPARRAAPSPSPPPPAVADAPGGGDELAAARARRARQAALDEARRLVGVADGERAASAAALAAAADRTAAARERHAAAAGALDDARTALRAAEEDEAGARRRAAEAERDEAAARDEAERAADVAGEARAALARVEDDAG